MWRTALALSGEIPGTASEVRDAEEMATLPMRMGGLGLRSAGHCARAAYWASWADALPMINQRNSSVADMVVARLSGDGPLAGCPAELDKAAGRLEREGFWWKPSWSDLQGKQWRANLGSGNMGGNIGLLPSLTRISGRGPCWLAVPPLVGPTSVHILVGTRALHWRIAQQHQSSPFPTFRTLLLERLQLPLQITEAECEGCQAPLDPLGRHRASCTRSRGVCPTERFPRDMNINVPAQDSRHIEVLAQDLPCSAGAQIVLKCFVFGAN